jgi:hypothetical protein
MKEAISMKCKDTSTKTGAAKPSAGKGSKAYGDKSSLCVNTDCALRKKAGGCFGFEGCPGFKAR